MHVKNDARTFVCWPGSRARRDCGPHRFHRLRPYLPQLRLPFGVGARPDSVVPGSYEIGAGASDAVPPPIVRKARLPLRSLGLVLPGKKPCAHSRLVKADSTTGSTAPAARRLREGRGRVDIGINVLRSASPPSRRVNRRVRTHRNGTPCMARVFIVLIVGILAWRGYETYIARAKLSGQPTTADQPPQMSTHCSRAQNPPGFRCMGRVYCSQIDLRR